MSKSTDNKKTFRKTRNGCSSCKRRRIKCDETRPRCKNCSKKDIDCLFQTTFKWARYELDPYDSDPKLSFTTIVENNIVASETAKVPSDSMSAHKVNLSCMINRTTSAQSYKNYLINERYIIYAKLAHSLNQFPIVDDLQDFEEHDINRIYDAFKNFTSQILTIRSNSENNPWLTLIWPLALKNSVLLKGLISLTIFHLSGDHNPNIKSVATHYMKQSIKELAHHLSDSNYIQNNSIIILITCLVLARVEVLSNNICSGIAHLRGAKSSLLKLVEEYDVGMIDYNQQELELIVFGYRTFLYISNVARTGNFSLTDSPIKESQEWYNDSIFDNPVIKYLESKSILFSQIDPVLGCFSTLLIIVGKSFTFINRQVSNALKCSYAIITAALELKLQLESWEPDSTFLDMNLHDSHCDKESCLKIANCYRYSALLYLHQAVPDMPSRSCQEFVQEIIGLLKEIPLDSKVLITSISPMFYAACEAENEEDREWFDSAWEYLKALMRIGNIHKIQEVVKECWRRKDSFKALASDTSDRLVHQEGNIRSVSHWTSVMDDFGWEIMRG